MKRSKLRSVMIGVGFVAGLAPSGGASATLLGNPMHFPLLSFDSGGTTSYDATFDLFRVDALPIALRLAPGSPPRFVTPNPPVAGEYVTIAIGVDSAGNLIGGTAGDDLAVFGFVDLDGNGTVDVGGTLLTGEVTGFGFQENGATDLFDFSFVVTGGALAADFGGVGGPIGTSLQSERSGFTGSFIDSFRGKAKGTIGVIPEPATLLLLGSGVAGLAVAGRRRAA